MDTLERLRIRAKAGLSNPALVTDELLNASLEEASEIIDTKAVNDTLRLDIAYFRFILSVQKDGVSELDVQLYSKALAALKAAPEQVNSSTTQVASPAYVGKRSNNWG